MTETERLTLERDEAMKTQAPGAASMPAHVVRPLDLVLWAREALERMRTEVAETRPPNTR